MPELTLIDLRKELVDLKIRVNNLEKRMSGLQKEVEPKPKTCNISIFSQKNRKKKCMCLGFEVKT